MQLGEKVMFLKAPREIHPLSYARAFILFRKI